MFRESSAQHFPNRINGDYDMNIIAIPFPNELCCDKNLSLISVQTLNWRNRKFLHYLSQIDSSWNNYIGWIPFYNFTANLYDMHFDVHKYLVVDCTHFAYLPFLFAPLWYNIETSLHRLIESRSPIPFDNKLIDNINLTALTMLIKKRSSNDIDIYLYENGMKRLFKSTKLLAKYKHNLKNVVEFSDVEFDNIPEGLEIS